MKASALIRELTDIEILCHNFRNREQIAQLDLSPQEQASHLPSLLWSAPEILTSVNQNHTYIPTKACDVYSLAIILFEILTRDQPYEYHDVPVSMPFSYLLALIRRKQSPLRPLDFRDATEVCHIIPASIIDIMTAGWSPYPSVRPVITEIRRVLTAVSSEMKRLADLTIVNTRTQIEHFKRTIIQNSEETAELRKELKHTQTDFLTRWGYEATTLGEISQMSSFHQVSYVMQCSLVNYEELCGSLYGDAVLYLVSRLCQIVDYVLPRDRNIHRLHSSGDDISLIGAVPSGGIEYAAKMATLALDLLCAVWNADLLDIDWGRMEVRVGLACGPLVTGICGDDHYDFTVFGTARDEALEMDNFSSAYQVLMTEAFYETLKLYPEYQAVELIQEVAPFRDEKKSYWLTGKAQYKQQELLSCIRLAYPLQKGSQQFPEDETNSQSVTEEELPVRTSLPPRTQSYTRRDARSGYLIEHFDGNEQNLFEPRLQPIHSRKGVSQINTLITPSYTPSGMFGSMLGAQGFAVFETFQERDKKRRKIIEEDPVDLRTAFVGQLGLRRTRTDFGKQIVFVGEPPALEWHNSDANQYDGEELGLATRSPNSTPKTALTSVLPALVITMQAPSQLLSDRKRKRQHKKSSRKRRKERPTMQSMLKKTSLWLQTLPSPENAETPEDTLR